MKCESERNRCSEPHMLLFYGGQCELKLRSISSDSIVVGALMQHSPASSSASSASSASSSRPANTSAIPIQLGPFCDAF